MFLALHPMEFISFNPSELIEHLAMLLTATLTINCSLRNVLNKAFSIINFANPFSKFYHQYYDSIAKFHFGLISRLLQGLSEPGFYGDLVYKLKMILALLIFQLSLLKYICSAQSSNQYHSRMALCKVRIPTWLRNSGMVSDHSRIAQGILSVLSMR